MDKSISIIFHYSTVDVAEPVHPRSSAQSIALEAAVDVIRSASERGYVISATVVDIDGATQIDLQETIGIISVIKPSFDGVGMVVSAEPIFDFTPSHMFFKTPHILPVDCL